MTKFFKTGLLVMAMSISLVSCRETNTATDDDLRTNADININEDGSKVKIKTDDKKVKIKTDDDGNTTKKVKTTNDDY